MATIDNLTRKKSKVTKCDVWSYIIEHGGLSWINSRLYQFVPFVSAKAMTQKFPLCGFQIQPLRPHVATAPLLSPRHREVSVARVEAQRGPAGYPVSPQSPPPLPVVVGYPQGLSYWL